MALAFYVKTPPKKPLIKRIPQVGKKTERTFFISMTTIGIISMIFAIYPLVVWQFKTLPRLTGGAKIVPIPQGKVLSSGTSSNTNIEVIQEEDGFSYFFTNYKPQEQRPKEFFLTIPKLEINKATVLVDSIRFEKNLALFPGTAIPGEVGNAFVTGHSVLPQFNDAQNYKAIFTKLPELEIGDQIIIENDGQEITFVVQYSKIVNPKDISVLAPISQNGKNLTLMTCVPPGTNTKRLVVISSMI